jgi:NAD(P)H-flavin reductase
VAQILFVVKCRLSSDIITSLGTGMECGMGKCGRCNVGEKYVCKDGTVFSLAELDKLRKEY